MRLSSTEAQAVVPERRRVMSTTIVTNMYALHLELSVPVHERSMYVRLRLLPYKGCARPTSGTHDVRTDMSYGRIICPAIRSRHAICP
eukprot:1929862-Pleurochrysis_carterae.AAC.1